MKTSLLSSTAALGIVPLSWNSFSQAATASYVPLAASFTPGFIQVIAAAGAGYYPDFTYRFYVGSGNLPAWIKPGAPLKIAASVSVTGTGTGAQAVSQNLSDTYVVSNVDAAGQYFDVPATRSNGSRDSVAFTTALAKTALDSGSGVVTTPLITLVIQAQIAFLVCTAGSITLAPAVDNAGAAPYSITLASTAAEYTISAQPGSKFDLEDWQLKTGTTGTLAVRFL